MAREGKKQRGRDFAAESRSLSTLDHIDSLIKVERSKKNLDFDEYFHFLRRWWCEYYRRPYKDPLLDEYSIEELYYEYKSVNYKEETDEEPKAPTEIPLDEWKWAEEEAAREEAEEAKAAEESDAKLEVPVSEQGLTDDDWADKYAKDPQVNPTADSVDGGDINATFGN